MSFQLARRERDAIPIISIRGRFVAGEPVEEFRSILESLESEGKHSAVLDMRETTYIDSSALGALVFAHTRAVRSGCGIAMFGLAARHLELMVLTKLSTVFHLYEDEIEAVNSCIPGRQSKKFDILNFIESQRQDREDRGRKG